MKDSNTNIKVENALLSFHIQKVHTFIKLFLPLPNIAVYLERPFPTGFDSIRTLCELGGSLGFSQPLAVKLSVTTYAKSIVQG